jgi:hypothetical protein
VHFTYEVWLHSNRRDKYVLLLNQDRYCSCVKWLRNIFYRIKLRNNRKPSSAFNTLVQISVKFCGKGFYSEYRQVEKVFLLWLPSACCRHWKHDSDVNRCRSTKWWKETLGMNNLLNKNTTSVCGNTLEDVSVGRQPTQARSTRSLRICYTVLGCPHRHAQWENTFSAFLW